MLHRGVGFDSDSERANLRFTDAILIQNAVATAMPLQQYGVNTPRVPDRTGMTGVAQGWASLVAKYESYVCFGSKIRWSMTQLDGSAAATGTRVLQEGVLYPLPSGATAITSNIADAKVQKYSRWHDYPLAVPAITGFQPSGDPRTSWRSRHSMTVGKIDSAPDLRNASYEANFNGDPSRVPTWCFNFQDILQDATYKGNMLLQVEIEYDTLFFRRLAQVNALEGGMKLPRTVVFGGREEKKEAPLPKELPKACAPAPDGYILVKRT